MPKKESTTAAAASGAPSVTRADLIAALGEDLSREYQAIIAYVVYSQVLKGAAVHVHRRGAGETRRARN